MIMLSSVIYTCILYERLALFTDENRNTWNDTTTHEYYTTTYYYYRVSEWERDRRTENRERAEETERTAGGPRPILIKLISSDCMSWHNFTARKTILYSTRFDTNSARRRHIRNATNLVLKDGSRHSWSDEYTRKWRSCCCKEMARPIDSPVEKSSNNSLAVSNFGFFSWYRAFSSLYIGQNGGNAILLFRTSGRFELLHFSPFEIKTIFE